MEEYIGKKLEGRYEIVEFVGFGGMAIVFKARDVLENRFVAVKILKDEYLQNDDFKRRFRNESKAIALLSHPNVVKVLDVNFSDTIQYIVMEYIDGITLKEYIEQQEAVRWKEAVHFTLQILRALQHAHDNGIVHRDVKPQNVMLLEDGTIKVMDFGIARFPRENGKTLSDKAIGSVHYISPEQAKGDNTDEKTDIYAVGVMLYEMLTGKVPFDGDSPVSIAIKQMQIEPPLPSTINPKIPLGLEEIIVRAMQKDPLLRYQSASEMLRDIDEFKINPGVVFEYKYLDSDGSTKYFDRIDAHKSKGGMAPMQEKKGRSYTLNILAGVTAACVLLAGVALYFFFKGINNKGDVFEIKSFVGMTVSQAQKAQPNVAFKITEEVPSPEYDKGIIVEQTTKAGTKVKKNYEVEVIVSSGLREITMPLLINETNSSAKSMLLDLGISNIELVQKTDSSVPLGRVISTDPIDGTILKNGDKVILYVSAGAADEPVRVPTLIGKTEVECKAELARAGLTLGTLTKEAGGEKKGIAFWQSVDPDEKVKKGTAIDIKISTGEPLVTGTNISIIFPDGADNANFDFEVYMNSTDLGTRTINPAVTKSMVIDLALDENGLINGVATPESYNVLTISTNGGSLFAQYAVNFSTESVSAFFGPDYNLVFKNGYHPVDAQANSDGVSNAGGSENIGVE